ncbi:MAG: DMT family protein [Planctomycetes bacterium]|jgi:uncharacterized protein (DUF486 family)|nr:DMT family protein [Planctomycetota bacterium]
MNTILLLLASNVFMTVAWYWHLKAPSSLPLIAFIGISWLIALPEYCLAVPANRIGHVSLGGPFTAPQLKLIQEGLSLLVFLVFSLVVLKESPRWQDYVGMALIMAGLGVALSGRHESHQAKPLQPVATSENVP